MPASRTHSIARAFHGPTLLGGLGLFLVMLCAHPTVSAYPQFQLSTGSTRCSMCHVSPGGGGLLTQWGRDESADTISRGGNGDFLYGAYTEPDWIKLGVDLRFAGIAKAGVSDLRTAVFPMQGDTYLHLTGDDLSFYAAIGARAQARGQKASFLERTASREHYFMYRPSGKDYYVRAGRFFAPFGLRTPDHTSYIRRDLGFYAFEETYNLSGGIERGQWQAHATAFAPVPTVAAGAGPREYGGAAYVESLMGNRRDALWAAQAQFGTSDEGTRSIAGGLAKKYFEGPEVMLMAEADLVLQTFRAAPGPHRLQAVSHLSANWWPTQGVMLGLIHERFVSDVSVRNSERDGFTATLQWFPRAKWELVSLTRAEIHGTNERTTLLGMLQVHYYL